MNDSYVILVCDSDGKLFVNYFILEVDKEIGVVYFWD